VIVTDVEEPTGCVVMLKVVDVVPAGTVMLEGTVAAEVFELVRATTAPPAGAAFASVTVPVDGLPPRTLVGESESDEIGLGGASKGDDTARRANTRRLTPAARKPLLIKPPVGEQCAPVPSQRRSFACGDRPWTPFFWQRKADMSWLRKRACSLSLSCTRPFRLS
jgi:hypothetical protein